MPYHPWSEGISHPYNTGTSASAAKGFESEHLERPRQVSGGHPESGLAKEKRGRGKEGNDSKEPKDFLTDDDGAMQRLTDLDHRTGTGRGAADYLKPP